MRILKITGIFFASLLALIILCWGILNIAKFLIYSDYYDMETTIADNPGTGDGFICQGIAVSEKDSVILVSGYMKDESNSRIYVTDFESNSYYVALTLGGEKYTGHAGGIAVTGDTVYIAGDDVVHITSLATILAAKNGDKVEISEGIPVNNGASFVFSDETYVYVGEFHRDDENYKRDHIYETAEGTHYAIISRYSHAEMSSATAQTTLKPDKVYSIRELVQGACFMPDGTIVLSTSWGISSSGYYVYDESKLTPSGETFDGAPVYYLDSPVMQFDGPAMSEDMDYYNGMAITLTESASDKYIFGKFFFANDIIGLTINK